MVHYIEVETEEVHGYISNSGDGYQIWDAAQPYSTEEALEAIRWALLLEGFLYLRVNSEEYVNPFE